MHASEPHSDSDNSQKLPLDYDLLYESQDKQVENICATIAIDSYVTCDRAALLTELASA